MAFLLMRLITLLTLALVVLSAMGAGDFEVKVEGRTTVIYAAGETIVEVKLKVIADKPLPSPLVTNLSVFDKNGFRIAIDIDNPQITVTDDTNYAMRTGTVRQLRVNIPVTIHGDRVVKVVITVPKTATTDPTVPAADSMSKVVHHSITLSEAPMVSSSQPQVVSIQRLGPISQTAVSAFKEAEVRGAFDVRIVLTERPQGGLTLDKIQVDGGTASNLVVGVPFARVGTGLATLVPHPLEGDYDHNLTGVPGAAVGGTDLVPDPTGSDNMYHQYRVTITPYLGVGMVKISIKTFHDGTLPSRNVYVPLDLAHKPNGREQLRLAVARPTTPLGTGVMVSLPQREEVTSTVAGAETSGDADATATTGTQKTEITSETSAKAEVPDTSVMVPKEGRIYISEIMFARGVHGTLPQWIEISNGSRTEQVNLSGWTLTVENTPFDADVSVGSKATFTISEGMKINPSGQNDTPSTVLVVTEQGRTNIDAGGRGASQIFNLWTEQQVVLFLLGVTKRRYTLLSDMAFRITLTPLTMTEAMDVVGNLTDDGTVAWALPTNEGNARSSIIRRHVSAEPKDGEMIESWVLASDTGLAGAMDLSARSYYGLPIDVGTPGFRAGGALPVELSHFRPAHDKATGAVVITWSTQSELNNAGFFIRRSQQRDGRFVVVNPTMIPGAGTTSEKQFYTYTDTTARPNVVYYYQIEDVSFDGNRQTLTRGIRLKGHVGAAGKAAITWGELKR